MAMNWAQLLSPQRIQSDGTTEPQLPDDALPDEPPLRTEFQRDADRIIFSPAFRRLKDKTQVFPLPENDLIHSRLTHSIEVAVVGRSLGFAVGRDIPRRHRPEELAELCPVGSPRRDGDSARSWAQDCADIVAAACLAHDIGNPPFGHSGEDAIGGYFSAEENKQQLYNHGLTDEQVCDLQKFEGNAQGFRILTRLQDEGNLGMRLTAATLATFTKYPRQSLVNINADKAATPPVHLKKHGFFQSEKAVFAAVAKEVGLIPVASGGAPAFCRHPLAFLVEAADDISYRILDLEDGLRLNLVPRQKGIEALCEIAKQTTRFRAPGSDDSNEMVEYLRARAIKQLIIEVMRVFTEHEPAILAGTYRHSLLDEVPSFQQLAQIRKLTETYCYSSRSVLEIELAGNQLIGSLLGEFIPAALQLPGQVRSKHAQKLLQLISPMPKEADAYTRVLRVTDYVASMTDSYAVSLYRRLKGIALPGAR